MILEIHDAVKNFFALRMRAREEQIIGNYNNGCLSAEVRMAAM
jgi:hypothetical protein